MIAVCPVSINKQGSSIEIEKKKEKADPVVSAFRRRVMVQI